MAPKAKSIISSREQRKEFDDAVRQVIQQRKAANQLQNVARAKAALEKQLQNNKVPQTKRQQEILQQSLTEQKRALQMLVLQQSRGTSTNFKGGHGAGRSVEPSQQHIPGSSLHGKRRATLASITPPSPQMLAFPKEDLSSEKSGRASDVERERRRSANDGFRRQANEQPGRQSSLSSRENSEFRSSTSDVPDMTIEEILKAANRGVAVGEIDGGLTRSRTTGNLQPSTTAQAPNAKNERFAIPSYRPKPKRIETTMPSLDEGDTPREYAEAKLSNATDQSPPPRRKSVDIGAFDVKDLVPTRRRTVDDSAEAGTNARSQQIGKRPSLEGLNSDKELESEGTQNDSNGIASDDSCDPSLPHGSKEEAVEAYKPSRIADPQPKDTRDDQTLDSHPPSGGMPAQPNVHPVVDDDNDVGDPRSQFVLLKKQLKSQSGATGQTGSTSQSSLFSSQGTIKDDAGERLISVTTVSNSGAGTTSIIDQITSIKEEDNFKRDPQHQDSWRASQSSISAMRDELSLKAPNEGFTRYKKKRNSRIKRLRQGIRKTIGGSSHSARAASSGNSVSDYPDIGGSEISRSSISISTEQQEGVSRLLLRNSSARSITSAYTTISGMTQGSEPSQSSRWSRFRFGGRSKARAQSMINIENGPAIASSDGGRRQIFVNQRSMSAVSNISSRSSSSASSTTKFLDIYDANDHANAVRSILSKSNSGRSLKTSLATVEEPSREDEAAATEVVRPDTSLSEESKRDEDHLAKKLTQDEIRESCDADFVHSESTRSDDSVNSFYRHPSHEHTLVHIRPNQVFPNSPGWQCDVCFREFFDLNKWAYVSTTSNFVVCEICFAESGHAVGEH